MNHQPHPGEQVPLSVSTATTATARCAPTATTASYTNYEPNSNGAWKDQPDFSEPPLKLSGDADHWKYPCDDADYYEQPGKLFRVMTPEQQEALFGNTARAMAGVPREIQIRHIYNCSKADPAYGKGVADALGIPMSEVKL